jgi:hypothetical protein
MAVAGLGSAGSPVSEARRLEELLDTMHPDHGRYVRAVRPAPSGAAASHLYLGLVNPRGRNPMRATDVPLPGAGRRYDLLVFPGSPAWTEPWTRLLLDHEYFHARHLARGDQIPRPTFDKPGANHHFQEALAWGYSVRRAAAGAYGNLTRKRQQEALQRYREHRRAFARYVRKRQPAVWEYYARLLPEPSSLEEAERSLRFR